MKQITSITATSHDSVQLFLALKSIPAKPVSNFISQTNPFYHGLIYQLNKEDEFDKTLYWEEVEDNELEDEFDDEEENTRNNYEEDYEFDYHRHK